MKASRILALAAFVGLVATPLLALNPGTDLWVIAAAKEGNWVTDLIIYNGSATTANVEVYWLARDVDNSTAAPVSFTVNPGQTLILDDVVTNTFGLASGAGAIRVVSNVEVVATCRIYDVGDGTNGTRGQGFEGVPIEAALTANDKAASAAQIAGVIHDTAFKTNFFAVNTGTTTAKISWSLLDDSGSVDDQNDNMPGLPPMAAKYYRFGELFPNAPAKVAGTVQAVVTQGSAMVVGSTVDRTSTDPTTKESTWPLGSSCGGDGVYTGLIDYTLACALLIDVQNDAIVRVFADFVFFSPEDGGVGCGHTASLQWVENGGGAIEFAEDDSFTVQFVAENSYDSGNVTYTHNIIGQREGDTISGTWQVDAEGPGGCSGTLKKVVFTAGHTGKPVAEVIPTKPLKNDGAGVALRLQRHR